MLAGRLATKKKIEFGFMYLQCSEFKGAKAYF